MQNAQHGAAPFVHLEHRGTATTPLVHYQFLDEEAPRHLSSQKGNVIVVDLQNSTSIDKAFSFNFSTGASELVSVRPTIKSSGSDPRPTIVLDIKPELKRLEESPLCRYVVRARLSEETEPLKLIDPEVRKEHGTGIQLFRVKDSDKLVLVLEGPQNQLRKLIDTLASVGRFSEFEIVNEGYPPYQNVHGCSYAGEQDWEYLENAFPHIHGWMKNKTSLRPMYEEFSSRSEVIRSLLLDKDLKVLSSELESPQSPAGIVSPVPSKAKSSYQLESTDGNPSQEENSEKPPNRGFFSESQRPGSPPIRVSHENSNGMDFRKTVSVLGEHGKEAGIFASPPPRMLSPMPWAQPSMALRPNYSPVPLGNRVLSHASSNSENQVPGEMNTYIQQFDVHINHCIKNALASVKAQMEELAEAYRKLFIDKLNTRQTLQRPTSTTGTAQTVPPSPSSIHDGDAFPFARSMSESRRLENSRRRNKAEE
eukprot:CAMPEP_0114523842 /NCGR_PEP_ID=MMETSP0109-20121206/21517_1 /TAXON_ID=29199 /ORGANISM="Chlorarachnion reptans, Strain CCCM449" /LENGTH=478 /DNA_ID=CAMNT_0001705205 /DNA_START=206 /DNA_END=1642 /DNA_ORIENTATION=+